MYKAAVNFLRGQVLVHIESGCPERVVNLCAGAEVPFWDVQWLSPVELTLRTTRRGLAQVRRAAEQVGAAATVRREQGAPLLARRLRRRYVLLAAALLTVLLVVEGNFTIWEFQVSGNETVSDEAVLRALEDYGITIGTRSLDIDQKDMRNHVLLELEDVVWLAVNVRGCVARVQVVERVRGQDMVEDGPANVVARRPGLVTRVEALGGQAAVVPGDTVTQGQLLISGAVDLDNGGLRWQHGMGRVWARTWYELTAQVPLTVRQRGVPLSSRTRYALDIGKKRIKLYAKGSTLGGDCDKITQYRPVCLPWGLRLPITVAAETVTAYGPSTDVPRSTREARDEGESLLRRQLDMVEDGPANVVARRPGLVTRVEALGGQAAVVPGDTVTQGQLLISGAVDLDNGGLRWQHGMGRVWARTWYELTAQVPLTVRQRGVPLSSRTRYALDIGKKRIKLYAKGSTLGGDCDKITQYRPVCLPWGLRLPITVAAETVTAYGPSTDVPRSTREARDEGESLLRRQLEELLGDTGTAENVRIDAVEQGQWLLVTLRAECLEEIGREVPLTKE